MTGTTKPTADSEPKKPETEAKPKKVNNTNNITSQPKAEAPQLPEKKTAETQPKKAPETPAGPKRALVIDDEPANRDFLVRLLQQAKLEVHGAESGTEALKIAESIGALALVVIDNKLPDIDGVDLLIKLHQSHPEARMVMATMLDERALMAKAFENGCNVFLVKPHGFMELFRRIQQFGPDDEELNRMIIDQYGLRPYRG
jgi:CheY-like chemotaxis protein